MPSPINGIKWQRKCLLHWKRKIGARVWCWQLRQELCRLLFPFLSSIVSGWTPVWSSPPGLQGSVGSGCADTVSMPDMRAWSKLAHSAWPISTGLRIRETGSWERHRDNLGETKRDGKGYGEWTGWKKCWRRQRGHKALAENILRNRTHNTVSEVIYKTNKSVR